MGNDKAKEPLPDDGTPGMSMGSMMHASFFVMMLSTVAGILIASAQFPGRMKSGNLSASDWPVIRTVFSSMLFGVAGFWYVGHADWARISSKQKVEKIRTDEFAIHLLGRTWRWSRGPQKRP